MSLDRYFNYKEAYILYSLTSTTPTEQYFLYYVLELQQKVKYYNYIVCLHECECTVARIVKWGEGED